MQIVVNYTFPEGRGVCNPQYLVIHETANPGATALDHVSYWRSANKYVRGGEANYVADWSEFVYHVTPDDRVTWHVGGSANSFSVGIELCHATNKDDFEKVWRTGVEFAAWWLGKHGWGTERMVSHNLANKRWNTGSDHTDPDGYFAAYGKSWAQFVEEVQEELDGGISMAVGEKIYNYLTEKTDASGRGKVANVRDRLAWMAQKQEKMQNDIDEIKKMLAKLVK